MKAIILLIALISLNITGCTAQSEQPDTTKTPVNEAELRKTLTAAQCHVLLDNGTERPFSGKYNKHFEDGIYKCAACSNPLYKSDTKYDSGSGWPAFWEPIEGSVEFSADFSHGMVRTEVTCSKCGSHLGHVFDDGPNPTGKRHCINSVALNFEEEEVVIEEEKKPVKE